ncbi:MAG: MBL fold metallo-hydrolase [Candidatus Pelagadaptatus aseana]|uniref:MBL fold metallo-hydrolase RNA specificity domain-containing protein n=1 Tax=Candidatus Pelagadaptatus aseana TaxID=3120508 RepID=UPI0039B2584A
MQILHHGATTGVTGSCHELRIDSAGILIDCGLFQGAELSPEGSSFDQLQIDFPIDHIKALVVTHVHIDHVGRIPYLIAAGFRGPIYCSEPSAKLLPLVLEDAVKIGFTKDKRLIERFLKYLKQQLRPLPYKKWTRIVEGGSEDIDIKLKPAGHILGSAYVECKVTENQPSSRGAQRRGNLKKTTSKVIFSGDLGAPYSPLLNAPKAPYSTDILIIESTYGDKTHENRRNRRQRLQTVIEKALQNNGTVLIPAFSIGRTQELLYELEEIIHKSSQPRQMSSPSLIMSSNSLHMSSRRQEGSPPSITWRAVDIIIDSPLASKFTQVYRKLQPYWDKEARAKKSSGRHPLSFDQLTTIDSHSDHSKVVQYLKNSGKPAIVIAASGMCAGGRIVNYLKALVEDRRTDILFVGYQAKGTPGRDIQKYGPLIRTRGKPGWVELNGKRYDINASVHTISGYSAHADQKDLINFVKRMRRKPSEIRIVHGDDDAKQELKRHFNKLLPRIKITIP